MRISEMLAGGLAVIVLFGAVTGFFNMQPLDERVIVKNVYASFGRANGYRSLDDFRAKGFKINRQLDDYSIFGARTVEVYFVKPQGGAGKKHTVVFATLALGPSGLVLTSKTLNEPLLEFDLKGELVFKNSQQKVK